MSSRLSLQPSIRQLLSADALSEAQVLAGETLLDRQVTQVVFGFASARAGSLVVARTESLEAVGSQELASLCKDLAGVIAIRTAADSTNGSSSDGAAPASVGNVAAATAGAMGAPLSAVGGTSASGHPAGAAVELQAATDRIAAVFAELGLPLVLMPGLGESAQVAEEIRLAFQGEIKRASSRLHSHFLASVLEEGLQGLVDQLAEMINRPVAIETSDFKILAAQNMGPTPANQQKTVTEEVAEEVNRELRGQAEGVYNVLTEQPFRIGRRLVMPIILEGVVVGYVSIMMRPTDDIQYMTEYLAPAALAALVDFSHRRKEVSTFTVTQNSLLKDLLSGRMLSAGDQERLEQHFGFDLCDGFIVLVVQVVPHSQSREADWPQELPMVEMENTRVFVIPHDGKAAKTWQQHAEELVKRIKKKNDKLVVQLGASRMAPNLLDLSDSYREARQALIIGSMAYNETEFSVSYAELGIKRLLYLMIDHPELERFYEENLGLLVAYDLEWETELVETLRVYLQHGANLNSAAKALFIHRHTMRYRLEQIAEILTVDIDSQEVLLNLQIAFLIRDMKGQTGS